MTAEKRLRDTRYVLDDMLSRIRRETVCILNPVCSLHFALTDWGNM